MYSASELSRISGSRLAVYNRKYIQDNGDIWLGTSDNRLKKLYTKDLNVGVELSTTDPTISLKSFISTLQTPLLSNFQTEIDFGSDLYTNQKEFTITNSKIKNDSIVLCSIAYDAPTGKSLDELEMDTFELKSGSCIDGSFRLLVTSNTGSVYGKFKINYSV